MRSKQLFYAAWVAASLTFTGCFGSLYKVAPLPQAMPAEAVTATTARRLEVSAASLADDDVALDRFGANLPLAGIAAVDVRVANRTAEPIKVGSLKFELRGATGKRYSRLSAKKTIGRLLDFYGQRIYGKEGYRQTRADFEALALPDDLTLTPDAERRGVLFFKVKQDAAKLSGLTLTVKGTKPPLVLRLN